MSQSASAEKLVSNPPESRTTEVRAMTEEAPAGITFPESSAL